MTTHVTPIITGLAFAEAPRWRADPTAPVAVNSGSRISLPVA